MLALQGAAGEMAGYGGVACMRGASRAARVAAGRGTSTHGGSAPRRRGQPGVRNRRRQSNGGGAPVSSGGRKKKASKGCFAKRKKYRGLSINIKFPTILGLK